MSCCGNLNLPDHRQAQEETPEQSFGTWFYLLPVGAILLAVFALGFLVITRGPLQSNISFNFSKFLSPSETRSCIRNANGFCRSERPIGRLSKTQIIALVHSVSQDFDISPEFVLAVIQAESNFNPQATSPVGAMGLMQLMPGTASELKVLNPYDPYDNIRGGIEYLSQLLEQFDGNHALTLAAYNAGPHKVRHYGGIPPYPETQAYVKRVLRSHKGSVQLTADNLSS